MITIRQELKPYLKILTEKLKGKYFVLDSSVYKIHEIKLSDHSYSSWVTAIVENLMTKEIVESDWAFLVDFEIFEFESDEAALLYREVKEDD